MTTKPYDLDEQCLNESAGEEKFEILNETIPATKDFKSINKPNDKSGHKNTTGN